MALVRTRRRSGRSRILTLADPQRQNALSAEMVAAIEQVLDAAPRRPRRAGRRRRRRRVQRRGRPEIPVGGAGEASDARRDRSALRAQRRGRAVLRPFAAAPFVTVAVVDGAAVGGGMGLAAAADIVLATAKARFALTETSLGIPPAQIAPYLVPRLGERVARRLALTGARLDGGEAAGIGLADVFCESDEERDARLASAADCDRALRAGRQRGDEAAVSRLPRRTAGRLYRDGGAEFRRRVAWPRGAGRACGVRREARAFLGEERQMSARFQSVLIANRGEIACRIIRAARAEGLRAIAVYCDADANAPHVRLADAAVRIGPSAPAGSYLSIGALIDAAKATGAEALHPGYGFLAENAGLAEACGAAGLVFVGPPPAAIRAMGDKSAAKRSMEAAGVPCAPGYHGDDQSTARFATEAERIGYPVMVKATAGGGGRGMRIVREPEALEAALARGPLGGRERVRRRAAADRARAARRAPCRGAGVRRRIWRDRPSWRARLFDPAPPSEGDRGGAVAGGLSGTPRGDGRGGGQGGRGGRLCRGRDGRVPARGRSAVSISSK